MTNPLPSDRITREDFEGTPVVCVHIAGVVLIMSETQYTQAISRGKAFRRWQTTEARLAYARAREEAQQLAFLDDNSPSPMKETPMP